MKTLKEIKISHINGIDLNRFSKEQKETFDMYFFAFKYRMKEEAKKWIKELRRMEEININEGDLPKSTRDFFYTGKQLKCPRCNIMCGFVNGQQVLNCMKCELKIDWIKEFFNLNEDDFYKKNTKG